MNCNIELLLSKGLIGLQTRIIDSQNNHNLCINGKIIDETKNIIKIKTGKTEKQFIKKQNKFEITINDKKIIINGHHLIGRPDERIKKWLKSKSRITKTLELR